MKEKYLLEAILQAAGGGSDGDIVYNTSLSFGEISGILKCAQETNTNWVIKGVGTNHTEHWIASDQAVALRESKGSPAILLIDAGAAGAGLDGIYNASRELDESLIYQYALSIIDKQLPKNRLRFAKEAVKRAARVGGRRNRISEKQQFGFKVDLIECGDEYGKAVTSLGLWPIGAVDDVQARELLAYSVLMVEKLLMPPATAIAVSVRINSLMLRDSSQDQKITLQAILNLCGSRSRADVLAAIREHDSLSMPPLRPAFLDNELVSMTMVNWRGATGNVQTWSGLVVPNDDDHPHLIIDRENEQVKSKLVCRWKAEPSGLQKGSVSFEARVLIGDQEVAAHNVDHNGSAIQQVVFSDEDFDELEDRGNYQACVQISAPGTSVEPIHSEDIIIRFGEVPQAEAPLSSGQLVRSMADVLVDANTEEDIVAFLEERNAGKQAQADKKGDVYGRLGQAKRGFKIERPLLLQKIEELWGKQSDSFIGRWRVRCRADGFMTGEPEYLSLDQGSGADDVWGKLQDACRKYRDNTLKAAGSLSRFYLHNHASAQYAVDYVNSWQSALESGDPKWALTHTVEVLTPGGSLVGLIVLPSHPVRVAWQSAYDELARQLRFDENLPARRVRAALASLDGSYFPFMLPGIHDGVPFVFGDLLGLSAISMVPVNAPEPKSSIATVNACYFGASSMSLSDWNAGAGDALAQEIGRYLDAHADCSLLKIHALRPGDASTVTRALGKALRQSGTVDEEDEDQRYRNLAYQLNLFSMDGRSLSTGAYLQKLTQRRRTGSAAISPDDAWSMESVEKSGGRSVPRLRWARRQADQLTDAAHIAVSFDSFKSNVVALPDSELSSVKAGSVPQLAYGLIANLKRRFLLRNGVPEWTIWIPKEQEGVKLANRVVTDRLCKLQNAIASTLTQWLNSDSSTHPVLRTEPAGSDIEILDTLHKLCDWVVSMDRNSGIELFDSPKGLPRMYESYLIDAVPERDDLGCLQMITSTAHFDEVRSYLDGALEAMGLNSSRRNCEFLISQIKSLSGRLAMRMAVSETEQMAAQCSASLIALSLVRQHLLAKPKNDDCWPDLSNGFLVPLSDIAELFPASKDGQGDDEEAALPVSEGSDWRGAGLLFVSVSGRSRLQFRFIDTRYRRYLSQARGADLVDALIQQVATGRRQWMEYFWGNDTTRLLSGPEKVIRLGKLGRVLKFYCDKAGRHYLDDLVLDRLTSEIDRLLRDPANYEIAECERADRAFILCPDYQHRNPEELFPGLDQDCRVWLFGPHGLPDRSPDQSTGSDDEVQLPPDDQNQDLPPLIPQLFEASPKKISLTEPSVASSVPEPDVIRQNARVVLGNSPANESEVVWSPTIKGNPHLMIAGLPGMGKTTCLISLCRQLHAAGIAPIVFSYHDDIDEIMAKGFADLSCRSGTDLGFNPMRVVQNNALAHIESAGQLRDIFAAIFPELGDLQLEQIRSAIKNSYLEQGWGGQDVASAKPPLFRRFVELLRKESKPDKSTLKLLARLSELEDFGFFHASEDASSLLDCTTPQILQIHSFKSEAVQRAYASFSLYSIYQDMFQRKRAGEITHAVIFDEAHRAAKLRLIPTMAKECRKYGLSMIVASQEAKDFDSSLFSAIANYLVLRVTDQDAKALAKNVAPSDIEKRTSDRLKMLPKYEALYFAEGSARPTHVKLLTINKSA